MSRSTQPRATAALTAREQASHTAGRAAGYCWARNPYGPGRCTWPPHTMPEHKDHYEKTEWT